MQHILDNLFIAISTDDAERHPSNTPTNVQCIEIDSATLSSVPLVGFEKICNQIEAAKGAFETDCNVVVCARTCSNCDIDFTSFCIGAYSILHQGRIASAVQSCIEASGIIHTDHADHDDGDYTACRYVQRKETLYHNLRAVEKAKALGWLADPGSQDESFLDIEEFAHYANVANGTVHLAVPGALIFFPTPTILHPDQDWIDIDPRDGRPARLFSPTYYAALFHDFGVSCVVCLGRTDPAVAAAFKAEGIETEDLGMAVDGSSLLRGLDRLLSLSRAAPGTLAVHSGEGFEWPRYTATLAKAFMMSRLGLDEGSAGAWLGMTCPWML
jgi:hypothetical protein